MTRILLLSGLAALSSLTGWSADTPAAAAVDVEARRASVAQLESHIAQREQRLAEWGRDMVALDARIEKHIADLVTMLAGLRDSQDSRTRVSRLKQEAIEGLQRGIDLYLTKRREVREKIRTGDTAALGDLSKFDTRIIKRVDQIAELAKSIPTHTDVQKYQGGGDYWNGYYYEASRISDEWRQNRRDTVKSNQVRKDTREALQENLERLDQRRRTLNDFLTNRKVTDAARALYTTELGQIDAYQDHLNALLRDVTTATAGGGQAIGLDQANDIDDMIEDARKDIREDVASLFRLYDQFVRGRAYLEQLKDNLAARKDWLKENAPAATGAP